MKRTLFILFATLIIFLLVFQTYSQAQERWVTIAEDKSNGRLAVEVTTYDPLKGAWFLFDKRDKKKIIRIIEEKENMAVCFNACIENDVFYTLQEKQCAIISQGTVAETIFMSLLVIRNEYEKRKGIKK